MNNNIRRSDLWSSKTQLNIATIDTVCCIIVTMLFFYQNLRVLIEHHSGVAGSQETSLVIQY